MNILVCVKQVPEADAQVHIDVDGRWITLGAGTEFRMNRFDECAVEAAVRIKEQLSDTRIHVLTIGPERSETILRRSIGMGADDGTHLVAPENEFVDPHTVAAWIADRPQALSADLILCGAMSEDLMQGLVGPLVAAMLKRPCTTSVVGVRIHPEDRTVGVEREVEGGCRQTLVLDLPALLTIQTGVNQPRYPALSKLLRANQLSLEILRTDRLDRGPNLQAVDRLMPPRKMRQALFLEGSTSAKADQLIAILRARSLLT